MVETKTEIIGDRGYEIFTILNDGFLPSGFVEMKCRLSDMECEGEAFFIDVTNEIEDKQGDYAPLEMNKKELKQFIEYLNLRYNEMP